MKQGLEGMLDFVSQKQRLKPVVCGFMITKKMRKVCKTYESRRFLIPRFDLINKYGAIHA